MARQQLGKALSGGVIALCVILLLTPVSQGQMRAVIQKFTISGSVGMPGVTMQGLPGAPITDDNGVYSAEITYGKAVTVTPVKLGYTFEPRQVVFEKVTENKVQDFTATLVEYTISGSVGLAGVTMQGLPGNVVSDENGKYSATVTFGFTDTVVPTLPGYRFEPPSKMYDSVKADQVQTYKPVELTFPISGSVGAEGVMMKGLPGNPISGKEGQYSVQVPYGWDGKVVPTKEGYEFTPTERVYADITGPMTDEIYISRVYTYLISGTTSLGNVMLKGLPGDPITDTTGFYEVSVEHGWEGTVTPYRAGYTFQPPSMNYTKVTSARENQNYTASVVQLKISGRIPGVSGAVMQGLPGNPVTDQTGFYSAEVEYGWTGDITPIKEGYEFDPPSAVITSLANDMSNKNFKATPITYTISGSIGVKGVVLSGLPGSPVTGADGLYSVKVPYRFSGTVVPRRSGYEFDPPRRDYTEVTASMMSENYRHSIIQHEISGRISADSAPVDGIFIRAGDGEASTTTDASGNFTLSVDHGWRGTITPVKDGYTFTPVSKTLDQIYQARPNINFLAKVKMMTITDSIMIDDGTSVQPIEDVLITANPGGMNVKTGADGKYHIQVPYGWTGELVPTKEGFNFFPASTEYPVPVVNDIDNTAPAPKPQPPVNNTQPDQATSSTNNTRPDQGTQPNQGTPSIDNTQPDQGTQPDNATQPDNTVKPVDPEKEALQRQIDELTNRLNDISGNNRVSPNNLLPDKPDNTNNVTPPSPGGTLGPVNTSSLGLLDVLGMIKSQTGANIMTDVTVKPEPVSVGFNISALRAEQVPAALDMLLQSTPYVFKSQKNGYLVYRPITNEFIGDELPTVLQDIAYAAGVVIVPDANVAGSVYGSLDNVPLDTALNIVLGGTPFIAKKYDDYYVVHDKGIGSDQSWKFETRHVRLSYTNPQEVASHLSKAFKEYVNVSQDPNNRVVSVTAPTPIVERIVADIKEYDAKPGHVILEARVVAMQRNDLLDVGVEWGWPQLEAGAFNSSNSDGIWAAALGYGADATFTESLLVALNLLVQNEQADIVAKPVVAAQDGKMSDISVMEEEYYLLTPDINTNTFITTEMVTITSGTKLQIVPHIGDDNDITLEIATEVSESIPQAAATDLPVVTRRTSRNVATVKDGGTVALAGLSRTNSKLVEKKVPGLGDIPLLGNLFRSTEKDETTQEVAVFITATIVRDVPDRLSQIRRADQPQSPVVQSQPQPTGGDIRSQLEIEIAKQR